MKTYFEDIVSDGEYFLDLPTREDSVVFFVSLYSKNGTCTTGTGIVSLSVEPIEGQFFSIPSEGESVINLLKTGSEPTYNPPVFLGGLIRARAVITGLQSGLTLKILVRSKG